MSTPQQHSPPVHACAAGAVVHAHAAETLEPAVLLHTDLPPGVVAQLDTAPPRVDVSGDGPGASTLTVRVLLPEWALAWQLPIAPFVAALPGQLGDDGRMVLLAVIDAEPEPAFWSRPVDCEHLAAELQLPVADLFEALHGRLTRWLADDLEDLLHEDAHERALEHSPAQTVADAVLAHYRGDLDAAQVSTRLVRTLEVAPDAVLVELAARMSSALLSALALAAPEAVEAVRRRTGPFEVESLRLLDELPPLVAAAAEADRLDAAVSFIAEMEDREAAVRAVVGLSGALAREALGADLPGEQVLQHLGMVDDAGLLRLASLWVALAAAAQGRPSEDPPAAEALLEGVRREGRPGLDWLGETGSLLARLGESAAGRQLDRVRQPLQAVQALVAGAPSSDSAGVTACIALARFVRSRAGAGPSHWLTVPAGLAGQAVAQALLHGMDREVGVDLFDQLLEGDVQGPDVLEAFVCATAQLLVVLDAQDVTGLEVAELLGTVPRASQWLLTACLAEAPDHDPDAADLRSQLPRLAADDVDRRAEKAGRVGVLRAGLPVLDALGAAFGSAAQVAAELPLGGLFPAALAEHDLLRRVE